MNDNKDLTNRRLLVSLTNEDLSKVLSGYVKIAAVIHPFTDKQVPMSEVRVAAFPVTSSFLHRSMQFIVEHESFPELDPGASYPVSQAVMESLGEPADGHSWNNDSIQFIRLIAELNAIGTFDSLMLRMLALEMGLTTNRVQELVLRAEAKWKQIKNDLLEGNNVHSDNNPL